MILWRIIVSTHIIKSTGSSQLDRKAAKDNYERLRQSYNETLSQFKERFDYAIEALEQTEHPQIPEIPDQVIHFISALNESRHHEWKTKMLNEIAAGHEVPENVVEAFELCDKYRPIHDGMYQNHTNHMTTYMSRTIVVEDEVMDAIVIEVVVEAIPITRVVDRKVMKVKKVKSQIDAIVVERQGTMPMNVHSAELATSVERMDIKQVFVGQNKPKINLKKRKIIRKSKPQL